MKDWQGGFGSYFYFVGNKLTACLVALVFMRFVVWGSVRIEVFAALMCWLRWVGDGFQYKAMVCCCKPDNCHH